jgi:hypothetical protein
MTKLAVVTLVLFALPLAALCQSEGDCSTGLRAPMHSGASLTIDSVSLGMEIVRTEQAEAKNSDPNSVRVSCTRSNDRTRVHMKLSGNADQMRLNVSGSTTHNGNLQLRVEVPVHTNLRIRMMAGQITITEIDGDKDCDLSFGQIDITNRHIWNYRAVDASVDIGEVNASEFNTEMGGFFRHFHASSASGEYALHAHVGTGQIDLEGPKYHGKQGTTAD